MSDKPVPQNIEAERAVLGAVLLDNAALPKAAQHLNSLDFFHEHHRKLFRRMLAMSDAGTPIDLVTLTEELHKHAELDAAGGPQYLASLADGMPRVSNVEHYCKIIKDLSVRRSVIHLSQTLQERAWSGEDTPQALLSAAQQQISTITPSQQRIVGGNGKLFYSGRDFLSAEFPVPEQLIEGVIFKGGSHMIIAMPHHLKTWFTLGIAMGGTRAGTILGRLVVPKPVRTLLITVEDFPGDVQGRMRALLSRPQFADVDLEAYEVMPRPVGGMDIMQESWVNEILRKVDSFKPDLIIFDVLRRIFKGDINSPKESSALCEQIDRIRDYTSVAIVVVHHENRKGEDIMRASAGSFNFPGWANVLIRFQRKVEEVIGGYEVSHVEIEVDHKFARSLEPVRMMLDLASDNPVRLEALEDVAGVQELRDQLGLIWTVNDLAEVLGVHKSNAKRRLKKFLAAGVAEKAAEGKRGRSGGLARYTFVGADVS